MPVNQQWAEFSTPRQYDPGQYIFKEGDAGDAIFFVVKGQVAIIKDAESPTPLVLNYVEEGELFGELSLLKNVPRTASAFAVEHTALLAVSRDDFWDRFRNVDGFRQLIREDVIGLLLNADESRLQAAAVERELFDRLGSLANENERMAEIMQLRQETMRFIVHDLRNPLNLVTMALSMIENDPAYDSDADSRSFLVMASGGIRRMYAMIESLLDVEMLESGHDALNLETVDVRELIDTSIEQHQAIARALDITLEATHQQDDLPLITGDVSRIERILTNLLDNALKFTPPGKAVHVTSWVEDGHIHVAVEDMGPGIAPEQINRVFDRFVRGGNAGKHTDSRGFGLGLAYCRSAVSAHGGSIRAENRTDGSGACVTFTLPLTSTIDKA